MGLVFTWAERRVPWFKQTWRTGYRSRRKMSDLDFLSVPLCQPLLSTHRSKIQQFWTCLDICEGIASNSSNFEQLCADCLAFLCRYCFSVFIVLIISALSFVCFGARILLLLSVRFTFLCNLRFQDRTSDESRQTICQWSMGENCKKVWTNHFMISICKRREPTTLRFLGYGWDTFEILGGCNRLWDWKSFGALPI